MRSPPQLMACYQAACELELQAFKPGNVSVRSAGHGMTVDDFRTSYAVSAAPLCDPGLSLGERMFHAVAATRQAVGCNTNLGIILLAAPLLEAGLRGGAGPGLRQALRQVLAGTTVADAGWAFKAIALAAPAGLGDAPEQDVRGQASLTLAEAMALARHRDRIAWQYHTGYQDIFDLAALTYYNAKNFWASESWAAVAVYVELLAAFPDSHIQRKHGPRLAAEVSATMAALRPKLANTRDPQTLLPRLQRLDERFKSRGINPGTSADLTVATLLAVSLRQGGGLGPQN